MRRRRKHVSFSKAEAAVVESQCRLFESLCMEVPAQDPRHKSCRGFIKSVQQLRAEVAAMRAQEVRHRSNIGAESPEEQLDAGVFNIGEVFS